HGAAGGVPVVPRPRRAGPAPQPGRLDPRRRQAHGGLLVGAGLPGGADGAAALRAQLPRRRAEGCLGGATMTAAAPAPGRDVRDLRVHFHADGAVIKAVDGVSFTLGRGEVLGIVGESGSGKSVTSLALMQLVPRAPGTYPSGQVLFEGRDLMRLPERELR